MRLGQLGVALVVAAVVLGPAAPVGAAARAGVALHVGSRVHRQEAALGAPPSDPSGALLENTPFGSDFAERDPATCNSRSVGSSCADIPIELTLPPHLADHYDLLRLIVSWDGSNGNLVQVMLYANSTLVALGPLSGTTPAEVELAQPSLARYDLTVANLQGSNRGFVVDASFVDEAVPSSPSSNGTGPDAPPAATPLHSGATAATASTSTPPHPAVLSLPPTSGSGSRSPGTTPPHRHRAASWLIGIAVATLALDIGGTAVAMRRSPPRWARMRLRSKLLVPFVVAIMVVGAGGTVVIVRFLDDRAAAATDSDLVQRSVEAEAFVRDEEAATVEAVRYGVNIAGLPSAMAAGDRSTAAILVASVLATHPVVDWLELLDSKGRAVVLYERHDGRTTATAGVDVARLPFVAPALTGREDPSGDKYASFATLTGTGYLAVAGPIATPVVGALVAGVRLDAVVEGAASRTSALVAIRDLAGRVSAGPDVGTARAIDRPSRISVGGRNEAGLTSVIDLRGSPAGQLTVAIPRGAASSVSGAVSRFVVVLVLALLFVIAVGLVLARHLTRRVDRLVRASERLGFGDLATRAPVTGKDEIDVLARGFNDMAEQLEASYLQLEQRVADRTDELRSLYDETVSLSEARNAFFTALSHEFRAPLFAIRGNAELMVDPELGPRVQEEWAAQAETIHAATEILLARVDEILELARTEATGMELHLDAVDVASVVQASVKPLQPLATRGGIELKVEVLAVPSITADAARLVQVVVNLVSNALKYSPPGGEVRVTAGAGDGGLVISVEDRGPGIPPGVGDNVFEPFYRVEGNRPQGGQSSTGLGLAVTKRIVEAHGGTITHRPRSGGGTTFSVWLPRHPPVVRKASSTPAASTTG